WTPDSLAIPQPTAQPRLVLTECVPTDETATTVPAAPADEEAIEESPDPQMVIPPDTEPAMANSSVSDSESADGFAFLDKWKRERKEQLDRLLRIVAEREAAAARAAEATKAAEAKSKQAGDATKTDSATP